MTPLLELRTVTTEVELYSEQDAETKVIVPALKKLGYVEGTRAGRKIVLRHQYPIEARQGREKRTIRADIVVYVDDTPVIVVDAKNPRRFLNENDREQVISYARLIDNVAPYACLCNGKTWQVFDTITKQQLPRLPQLKDLLKSLQERRLNAKQRDNLRAQATRTLFAIESARELSRLMRRCHDVIRNLKGYDPTRAFDELSKLLFAKMYEEREVADGRRENNRFTLDSVKAMRRDGVEIIQTLWIDTVKSTRYQGVFTDEDAKSKIELPSEAIDQIVEILQDKSLGQTDLDVKGVAFEEFLAATYRGGGLGQYFTPREVVNFMVDLVQPTIGETVIDPSCGSGGFLIRVYDILSDKIRSSELSEAKKQQDLHRLAHSSLVGIDWEARAARTCKMNMIIHGDGHAGVYQANGLDLAEIEEKVKARRQVDPTAPKIDEGTFDIVLTNPPFGARDKTEHILEFYELGNGASEKREVLMLERCIRLLRPGGRMAAVVPEGILSNKSDKRIREYILRTCVVRAVIRLPQDAFKRSEGAACTSVLYVQKKDPDGEVGEEQGDIFFARAEYCGFSPSGRPIEQNDLPAILEQYRLFEAGKWDGIELRCNDGDDLEIVRAAPADRDGPWLEPEVNRTSLLYDRLGYVVREPTNLDRFSYTYFHPRYYELAAQLDKMPVPVVNLGSLCTAGYPNRGKKPKEESTDGIPILKVRNVTIDGIDFDTEFSPDTKEIRQSCASAIVEKNDILITSTGEGTIGRVVLYQHDDDAIADSHVCICRTGGGINVDYLLEYLRSEFGQIQLLRYVSGSTGQTELLAEYVAAVRVPKPSDDEQTSIVESMSEARGESERLKSEAEALRREGTAVLAKAREDVLLKLAATKKKAVKPPRPPARPSTPASPPPTKAKRPIRPPSQE